MIEISIVIPVYNEADNIQQTLTGIEQKILYEHEILVVYDRDEDNTIPVVRSFKAGEKCQIRLIKNKYQSGALNAIKTGFEEAKGEMVVVTMADLSDDLETINAMLQKAKKEQADIVCGSRYMKDGEQIGGPFIKSTLSRCAGYSLYYLAGISTHDATNSFKLYRRSFLQKQTIESSGGFELGLELVVKAHLQGYKVAEVPTIWQDRKLGNSRFHLLKWLPYYLRWYFKALFRYK